MHKNSLAIATMTWARDEAEEELLRLSLPLLAKTGLPVYITDGGSNQPFLDFLSEYPSFHVYHAAAKGVWAQVRNSLRKAYEAQSDVIFYTEPDKHQFFQESLDIFLNSKEINQPLGIITASRSEKSFSSFPSFQQMTETTINHCCSEVTGISNDYTYGPFLMNRTLVPNLEMITEDIGWGWRPFLFCLAHRLGLPVKTITGNFSCPPQQQQDTPTERLYRMKQLQQNILGILLSSTVNM